MRQIKKSSTCHFGKTGIKWHIFAWLILFTAVIIALIWICQGFFLDSIYKTIKIYEIKKSTKMIDKYIQSEFSEDVANEIAYRNELCILLYKVKGDSISGQICSSDTLRNCVIHNTDLASKFLLFEKTVQNGGEFMQRFRFDISKGVYYSVGSDLYDELSSDNESIVYCSIIDNSNGKYFLILNSQISPVTATVRTLNVMLISISVVLVLIALIMASLISRRISKPIVKLNEDAKLLAKGNYGVDFSVGGYKEIKELSDSLAYAEDALSKVDSLRRDLIANISHDLRTPLTMITGYAEAIKDLPGENTPENMQIIIDESNRLTSLVNDVLDISKLESGVQQTTLEKFDLTEEIIFILNRYNVLKAIDGYKIYFEYSEHVLVETDRTCIGQIVYNLVNNAITYTGDDKNVYVRQVIDSGNKTVKIEVRDTGCGISEEQLPLIWDRYYKVDKTHKRALVGTGLGLSIVRKIMELLHGEYGVRSSVGNGSTFWFSIRYADVTVVGDSVSKF